jgi:hypothetical protein
MEYNQRTAPNFLHKGQGKSTHFQAIVEPSNTVKL